MTLLAFISSHRSFPSRVRSPTPAKTEIPPCSMAILRINSWIRTVLPTPAPPKRPVLPPRVYGSRRSTTLIPVSIMEASVACSSKGGGLAMNGIEFLGLHRAEFVHGLADHVQDPAQRGGPNGDLDRPTRIDDLSSPDQAVGPSQ